MPKLQAIPARKPRAMLVDRATPSVAANDAFESIILHKKITPATASYAQTAAQPGRQPVDEMPDSERETHALPDI